MYNNLILLFRAHTYLSDLLASIIAFILFIVLRRVLIKRLSSNEFFEDSERARSIKQIRFYSNFMFIALLVLIWFSAIQGFVFSMFAFVAAIVVATKELILCFIGGIFIKINKPFNLGDKIEIENYRGLIIEKNLTSIKILEIGPEKHSQQTTGAVQTIPNSIFLSKASKNESYFNGYGVQTFSFECKITDDFDKIEDFLTKKAKEVVRNYIQDAEKNIGEFCQNEGLKIPKLEPRTKISLNSKDSVTILLKIPVENKNLAVIEQDIIRAYCSFIKNI